MHEIGRMPPGYTNDPRMMQNAQCNAPIATAPAVARIMEMLEACVDRARQIENRARGTADFLTGPLPEPNCGQGSVPEPIANGMFSEIERRLASVIAAQERSLDQLLRVERVLA